MTVATSEQAPPAVRRSVGRLADGRRIYFYDERDMSGLDRADRRHLEDPDTASQLRYDALLDEWVVIAAHRQERTHLPASSDCPLCPSTPARPTEIPGEAFDVVVFDNRFPSLHGDAGKCEVVVFTADHEASFAELSPARVQTVMHAWADRTAALGGLPGVEQVFCFENRGVEIGVTLTHPHGQIYAYPYVTPMTARMLGAAKRHHAKTGRNLFRDQVEREQREQIRIVADTDQWVAYVPAAARWPFELHVYPKRFARDLTELDDAQVADFATLYPSILRRLDGVFGQPMPYMAGWYQAPVRTGRDLASLHLRVISPRRAPAKLKYLAASESAMGAFVNDIAPETAARMLRGAGP